MGIRRPARQRGASWSVENSNWSPSSAPILPCRVSRHRPDVPARPDPRGLRGRQHAYALPVAEPHVTKTIRTIVAASQVKDASDRRTAAIDATSNTFYTCRYIGPRCRPSSSIAASKNSGLLPSRRRIGLCERCTNLRVPIIANVSCVHEQLKGFHVLLLALLQQGVEGHAPQLSLMHLEPATAPATQGWAAADGERVGQQAIDVTGSRHRRNRVGCRPQKSGG